MTTAIVAYFAALRLQIDEFSLCHRSIEHPLDMPVAAKMG